MSVSPPAPGPSWKGRSTAPRPGRVAGRRWKREPSLRRSRGWASRATRAAPLVLLFAVTLGLLLWAVLWLRPPRPVAFVLVGAAYQDNLDLPANVYGWQGLEDLAAFADPASVGKRPAGWPWETSQVRLRHPPRQLLAGDAWDK